jgi:hypothetical protein
MQTLFQYEHPAPKKKTSICSRILPHKMTMWCIEVCIVGETLSVKRNLKYIHYHSLMACMQKNISSHSTSHPILVPITPFLNKPIISP